MDVLALRMLGKSSVALLGCGLTIQQYQLLMSLTGRFKIPKIIFLFDGDEAGRLGSEKIKEFLQNEKYMIDFDIKFCKENQDPCSMYVGSVL